MRRAFTGSLDMWSSFSAGFHVQTLPNPPKSVNGSLAKLKKCPHFVYLDVCWLRLDFETFQTVGPTSTSEPNGACPDTFVVTVRI
jgi:hypothetical protein